MARTDLTVQQIAQAGIAPAYTAATVDGCMIPGTGDVFLHVKNANAASCTVTVQSAEQRAGLDVADQTVVVPATTGDRMIGPFRPDVFSRATGAADAGKVYVDFSIQTSVTVAALRL